jgi:hypothetical protein
LLMPASRHCLVHLNEIERMLPKLKPFPAVRGVAASMS